MLGADWRRACRPGRARTATLASLGALTVLLAGLAGVGLWQHREATATAAARADGLAAAEALVQELFTIDYRTLPADTARAEAATTGDFTGEYRALIDRSVAPNAPAQRLVTKATARDGSVVSATPDRVVALVFIGQVTTSTNLTAPRLDSSGVRVTLDKVGGRWLIAKLDRV